MKDRGGLRMVGVGSRVMCCSDGCTGTVTEIDESGFICVKFDGGEECWLEDWNLEEIK